MNNVFQPIKLSSVKSDEPDLSKPDPFADLFPAELQTVQDQMDFDRAALASRIKQYRNTYGDLEARFYITKLLLELYDNV